MADTKISALPAATVLGDTDELVLNVAGANKKITGANVKASMPAGGAGALTLLNTVTLATPAIFDVSGIPGTYNDLVLVLIARGSLAGFNDSLLVKFNNDSGANYDRFYFRTTAATAISSTFGGAATSLFPGGTPAVSAAANLFGVLEMVIFGYASTTWNKVAQWRNWFAESGNTDMDHGGTVWKNTAAINRVTVSANTGTTFVTGSQLRIYGRT